MFCFLLVHFCFLQAQSSVLKLNFTTLRKAVKLAEATNDTTRLHQLEKQLIHQYPVYKSTQDSNIIELFAYLYGAKAVFYQEYQLYNKAISYYHKTILYHHKNHFLTVGRDYYDLADAYRSKLSYIEAINCMFKSLYYANNDTLRLDVYVELAKLYKELGEYDKSLAYNKIAISIAKEIKDFDNLSKSFIDRYAIFQEYEQRDSSYFYAKKALVINHLTNKIQKLETGFLANLNIGNYFFLNKNYQQSFSFYLKAEKILSSEINDYDKNKWLLYNNLALITIYLNNDKLHQIYHDSSFILAKKLSNLPTNIYLAQSYQMQALYHTEKKQYKQALVIYKQIFPCLIPSLQLDNAYQNPLSSTFTFVSTKTLLLEILIEKANLFIKTNQQQAALATYLSADTLIDIIRNTHEHETSKLFWREKAKSMYVQAIAIAYQLNKKETAFYLMEKSKAILLLDELKNKIATSVLPDSVQLKAISLQKQLNDLQENKALKADILLKEKEIKDYQQMIVQNYPMYARLKYENKITTIASLQATYCKKDNAIFVTYINTDSFMYAAVIQKDKYDLYKLVKPNDFNALISRFYTLTATDSIAKKWEIYQSEHYKIANTLYNILLKPLHLPKKATLLISPDNILWKIPFDALKIESTYLVENYTIQYLYSLSVLTQTFSHKHAPNRKKWGIFAPITFKNAPNLYQTEQAITFLKDKIACDIYLKEKASKETFKAEAKKYQYLWLATHASAGDNLSVSPYIMFANQNVYLADLYSEKLQAEAVILSACETQKGKIAEGEGIISLARAFAYMGVPITIAAQWSIDEASTMDMMKRFFIKNHTPLTSAEKIAEVKRYYCHEEAPYYWAGLAVVGYQQSNELNYMQLYWGMIGFMLLLIISLFCYVRKYVLRN